MDCISGSTSECTASIRIGESAGLTFREEGGLGNVLGNWPPAASIADCTSCAAASMLRSRSNCSVICVLPSMLVEVICDRPGISANWYSRGVATEVAIVSGLAPGRFVVTTSVGKSTCGSGATGNNGQATIPSSRMPPMSSEVAIGRRTNGAEMLMEPSAAQSLVTRRGSAPASRTPAGAHARRAEGGTGC